VRQALKDSKSGQRITATYIYDPLDRRISKTVTTSGGNPVETRYLYAGENVIAEYEAGNTLLRQYVHSPGIKEPVAMFDYFQVDPIDRVKAMAV